MSRTLFPGIAQPSLRETCYTYGVREVYIDPGKCSLSKRQDFRISTRSGEELACSFLTPNTSGPWPAAILFHGFSSNRRNKTNTALSPRLTDHGIAVITADLSGHGDSSGELRYQNILNAADEVFAVVDFSINNLPIDDANISLLGNSFSGPACTIAASQIDLKRLALKAPAFDYESIRRQQLGDEGMLQWEQNGLIEIPPGVVVDWSSIEMARSIDMFDVFSSLDVQTCVWQGTNDRVILPDVWEQLENLCDGRSKQFIRIEGADHRISGPYFETFISGLLDFLTT